MDMGREEARVRYMERVTWKLIICKIDGQREFAVWLRKLKRVLCQPRGVGWGERFRSEGIYVYPFLIHVEV